jgi:hypothetical protein
VPTTTTWAPELPDEPADELEELAELAELAEDPNSPSNPLEPLPDAPEELAGEELAEEPPEPDPDTCWPTVRFNVATVPTIVDVNVASARESWAELRDASAAVTADSSEVI